MIWPGTGDPYKRKKTLKFLGITAIIAISVGVGSSVIQGYLGQDNTLKACINDRDTPYKIKASLEIFIDGERAVTLKGERIAEEFQALVEQYVKRRFGDSVINVDQHKDTAGIQS